MKPLVALAIALAGGMTAAAAVIFVMSPTHNEDSLERDTQDRLLGVEDRLERIEASVSKIQTSVITRDQLLARDRDLVRREALSRLEADIESLKNSLSSSKLQQEASAATDQASDDVTALIDARIKQADKAKTDARKKRDRDAARNWARQSARKRVARFAAKHGLNADQSDRLTEALTTHSMNSTTNWGTIKDSSQEASSRLQAIQSIRTGAEELMNSARGILSTDQFDQFQLEQGRNDQKAEGWLQQLEQDLSNDG